MARRIFEEEHETFRDSVRLFLSKESALAAGLRVRREDPRRGHHRAGSGRNLKKLGLKSQNTRFRMADLRTDLDVAQAYVDHCVAMHNECGLSAEDAAKAKLHTSELEGRVTDEYPINRRYADARISRIYAGSSEIMREIIARAIGLDPRRKER